MTLGTDTAVEVHFRDESRSLALSGRRSAPSPTSSVSVPKSHSGAGDGARFHNRYLLKHHHTPVFDPERRHAVPGWDAITAPRAITLLNCSSTSAVP